MMHRFRKWIAIALLLLNFSGARVVESTNERGATCSRFEPAVGFKAIVRTVLHQPWRQTQGGLKTLHNSRHASQELIALKSERKTIAVPLLPPIRIFVDPGLSVRGPQRLWKLPMDIHPVQPAHLLSKK